MTRALRRRHRRAIATLAVLLPAGIGVSLAARPAPPPPGALGIAQLDAGFSALREERWQGRAGDASLALTARVGVANEPASPLVLEITVHAAGGQPETLAYWSPSDGVRDLPDDAILLGAVDVQRPVRLPLPAAAHATAGTLLLYRIAQGTIAARLPLPAASTLATGERS